MIFKYLTEQTSQLATSKWGGIGGGGDTLGGKRHRGQLSSGNLPGGNWPRWGIVLGDWPGGGGGGIWWEILFRGKLSPTGIWYPLHCMSLPSGVIKWVCQPMHTHINPWGRFHWSYAITKLTAHCMCDLMSDLIWSISKYRKSMVIYDTECPYWDQVSVNNTNTNSYWPKLTAQRLLLLLLPLLHYNTTR